MNIKNVNNNLNFNCLIHEFDTVDSTNTIAKQLVEQGAPEWTVVVANNQTEGRGRLGRSFFSPQSTGLYMSIVLRPNIQAQRALLITCSAAVAVSEAIEDITGNATQIKWVNDIFMRGKKVCGILTEGDIDSHSGKLNYAVLGIGININEPRGGFPPEIADIAGAVSENGVDKESLIVKILEKFNMYYRELESATFLPKYKQKQMLLGQSVDVHRGQNITQATAVEIDDECGLVVEYADGRREVLSSGEVSVRKCKD